MIVKDLPIRVTLMPAAPKANATYWVCQLKPGHCLQSECYGIEASCAINCKNQLEFSILRPQDFVEDGIGSRTPIPFFDYRVNDLFSGLCILQRQHHLGFWAPVIQELQPCLFELLTMETNELHIASTTPLFLV